MKKRRYRKVSMRNFKRATFEKEVRYTDDLGAEYAVINPTKNIPRRSYKYFFYSFIILLIMLIGSIILNLIK